MEGAGCTFALFRVINVIAQCCLCGCVVMQASLELCSRCVSLLQRGGDKSCRLLLVRHAPASTRVRRRTVGSFLRWKSSSRKAKKDEEHCIAATEGNDSSPVYFPLEGKANKPDYRAAGAVLPLSIDAESHRSSDAGRFYLHRSEEGGVVALPMQYDY